MMFGAIQESGGNLIDWSSFALKEPIFQAGCWGAVLSPRAGSSPPLNLAVLVTAAGLLLTRFNASPT